MNRIVTLLIFLLGFTQLIGQESLEPLGLNPTLVQKKQ